MCHVWRLAYLQGRALLQPHQPLERQLPSSANGIECTTCKEDTIADDKMAAKNPVHLQLTTLPTELLLRVYELLPSLTDALNLRTTCHTLLDLWIDHRTAIINRIIANQFECYPYARQLLADQRNGPPLEQRDLSDQDLSNLVRNAKRIEKVIERIEQDIIPGLQIDSLPEGKKSTIYGGNETHPSTLTQTERLRVIRACYQIWSLTYCHEDIIRAKAHSLRPRELFYLAELVQWARAIKFPGNDAWETFQIVKSAGAALNRLYYDTYSSQPPRFQHLTGRDDPVGLFVIWDHWQDNLKSLVCGRPLSNLTRDAQAKTMVHLWDDEPGDELLIVKD
ncbi:hypothetical protein CC78DRAFT_565019 [Lojkania enalia]|uniref:F-box domain-containing protein n=1 Tax=Lojkania enalia TaxID=147567 RepID=A0A9P4KIB2_9PLEO|nr:hypothetical protein CC78DRAFT_565019 [Didymosphaeria enalia]